MTGVDDLDLAELPEGGLVEVLSGSHRVQVVAPPENELEVLSGPHRVEVVAP